LFDAISENVQVDYGDFQRDLPPFLVIGMPLHETNIILPKVLLLLPKKEILTP
jgi:hypothetical protein